MKKIFVKIVILFVILGLTSFNVFAEENTTKNEVTNQTSNETQKNVAEEKPTETKMNETMYVQERCNIRSSYSVDSDRVGGLDAGTEVTVVAEYSNGWYKIEYDGGQAYIKSGILRSTKPEIEEEQEQDEEDNQEELSEEQTSTDAVSDSTEESTDEVDIEDAELINEIGVLPEVGKNIADYLYIGVIVIVSIGMIYIIKKY